MRERPRRTRVADRTAIPASNATLYERPPIAARLYSAPSSRRRAGRALYFRTPGESALFAVRWAVLVRLALKVACRSRRAGSRCRCRTRGLRRAAPPRADQTMLVAGASAFSQCTFRTKRDPRRTHAVQHGVARPDGQSDGARVHVACGPASIHQFSLTALPKPLVRRPRRRTSF